MMALTTKIESFARDIELIVRNDLAPAARSRTIAAYAQGEFDKTDRKNALVLGRPVPSTVAVDGRQGAQLESVNPDRGAIVFEWELIGDVLIWIGQALRDRSPVVSGRYREGHTLFADNVEIPLGAAVPPADEYVFTNLEPYTRKIEVGMTESGRPFVIQVPNHIYERTANDARARFGNIAKIAFGLRSVPGGAIGAWAKTPAARRHAAAHRRASNPQGWLTRQPAIVVTFGKV